jgi:prepilin-type N-terminal cleavage/methylation domain-containing protein
MRRLDGERGFTMIELLVVMAVFGVVSTTFYSVMFNAVRSSDNTEQVARVSEEARAGLNRMIRDTREGQLFDVLSATSYNVRIDFDGDGSYENPNEEGDYESITFKYNGGNNTIVLRDPINNVQEVLIAGVEEFNGEPIFSYTSNDLRYDWNGDGVTTSDELDAAPGYGYPGVSGDDTSLYQNVEYQLVVVNGTKETLLTGQAQLRNRR